MMTPAMEKRLYLLKQEHERLAPSLVLDIIKEFERLLISSGIALIAEERRRQIDEEGWTFEHDDQHTSEELASAALFYVAPEKYGEMLAFWPWDEKWNKKRKHNRIKQLAIAGALIAAEIDRLQRQSQQG